LVFLDDSFIAVDALFPFPFLQACEALQYAIVDPIPLCEDPYFLPMFDTHDVDEFKFISDLGTLNKMILAVGN